MKKKLVCARTYTGKMTTFHSHRATINTYKYENKYKQKLNMSVKKTTTTTIYTCVCVYIYIHVRYTNVNIYTFIFVTIALTERTRKNCMLICMISYEDLPVTVSPETPNGKRGASVRPRFGPCRPGIVTRRSPWSNKVKGPSTQELTVTLIAEHFVGLFIAS